jgi:hypothetical protein
MAGGLTLGGLGSITALTGLFTNKETLFIGFGATFAGVFETQRVNHRAWKKAVESEFLRNGGVITVWQRKK